MPPPRLIDTTTLLPAVLSLTESPGLRASVINRVNATFASGAVHGTVVRVEEEFAVLEKALLQSVNTFVGGSKGDPIDPERISIFLLVFNLLLCAQWSALLICSAWIRPFHQVTRICPSVEKCVESFTNCVPAAAWVWRRANRAAVNLLAWKIMQPIPRILGVSASEMLPILAQASLAYNIAWPFLIVPTDRMSSKFCDMLLRWQTGVGLDIIEWFGILGIISLAVSACMRCFGKREGGADSKRDDVDHTDCETPPRDPRMYSPLPQKDRPDKLPRESIGLLSLGGTQGARD